jgi:chromosome segregation ATPase
MVSLMTQTKAEAQKLIKLYNKLQAEAKMTNDTKEAARKIAEAEKLVLQINALQIMLNKLQAKEHSSVPTKPQEEPENTTTQENAIDEKKRVEFEERIKRIESAQKSTRQQIEQLNQAKAELSRLQVEAQRNAQAIAQERNTSQPKTPHEIEKLNQRIKNRDEEYQNLRKEYDAFRKQTKKDSELLREQRDAAVEKQKRLEKEKRDFLRYRGDNDFLQGLLVGVGLSVIFLIAIGVLMFMTPWLDQMVCTLKKYPTPCYFSATPTQVFPKK